jgi:hypothetical protein
MAKKHKPKIDVEEVEGQTARLTAAERLTLVRPVASSTISDGTTTLRSLIVGFPNLCVPSKLLDVTGIASSGADGKGRFRLTSFLCPAGNFRFGFPINVVATPLSTTPCFLTLVHTLVNNGADVEIEVSTWDAAGAPAPNVSFDWRCRVELVNVIL